MSISAIAEVGKLDNHILYSRGQNLCQMPILVCQELQSCKEISHIFKAALALSSRLEITFSFLAVIVVCSRLLYQKSSTLCLKYIHIYGGKKFKQTLHISAHFQAI